MDNMAMYAPRMSGKRAAAEARVRIATELGEAAVLVKPDGLYRWDLDKAAFVRIPKR